MIIVKAVTKKFRHQVALDAINLTIKKGAIIALIGQNGAGKTTLMSIISNLARPSQGEVEYQGQMILKQGKQFKRNMGVLIDSPALYKELTAFQNLEIICMQRGLSNKESIVKALELVGLDAMSRKKVKQYSMGMKQRLAIAVAIIGDPEFIILDEPTNGLDPMGIIEIRELIKRLNQDMGITIIVSSHQLAELYQVATEYIFMHEGCIVEQISHENLQAQLNRKICVLAKPMAKAIEVLEAEFPHIAFSIAADAPEWLQLADATDAISEISRKWHQQDVFVERMREEEQTLEAYFKSIIA